MSSVESPPVCPVCNSSRVVPIVYEMPSRENIRLVKEGKIVLGDCVISPDSPEWHCLGCENEWGAFMY